MIDEFGEPRLADFGVAAMTDWPSCTVTGALTGTPLYMSPEQARTEKPTPSSDIYSLGVVLYEALTSMLPYHTSHGRPVREVLKAVLEEEPRRPRLFRKEISHDLEAVLLKALEKSPRQRYAAAQDLADDLERALMGRPVSARRFRRWNFVSHFIRRHRQAFGVVALLVAAASGLYAYFWRELEDVQHESLIHYAQLQNAKWRAEQGDGAARQPAPEAIRAWHEIRLARLAMQSGDWPRAQFMLSVAADLSEAIGDRRSMAIAQLEQARCALMLYDTPRAQQLYREIMADREASPATVAMAQVEYLMLALLRGDEPDALFALQQAPIPEDGPLRPILLALGGALAPTDFANQLTDLPARYRNHAYLALAVRWLSEGDERRSATALRQAIQTSSPSSAWPAPFARQLWADRIGG